MWGDKMSKAGQVEQLKNQILNDFKQFCRDSKLNHRLAAEKLGCSRSHVTKIFNETRKPSWEILGRMEMLMEEKQLFVDVCRITGISEKD